MKLFTCHAVDKEIDIQVFCESMIDGNSVISISPLVISIAIPICIRICIKIRLIKNVYINFVSRNYRNIKQNYSYFTIKRLIQLAC